MTSYINQIKGLKNFESVAEFNASVNAFKRAFRFELTKSDSKVLFTLSQHAVAVLGACKIALDTLANIAGVSLSTVRRTISKLTKFGIIKKEKTRKENGARQGVNTYQFQPFEISIEQQNEHQKMNIRENAEMPCESKDEQPKKNAESLILLSSFKKDLKDTNITENLAGNLAVNKSALKDMLLAKIPTCLHNLNLFADTADDLHGLVGVVYAAKSKVSKKMRVEEHGELFAKTLRNVFEYVKRKHNNNADYNVSGLIYKAIKELCQKIANGTAYDVPASKKDDVAVNGVTQAQIDAETDPFAKQSLINKRNAKKVTGRQETLPDWFATRHEQKGEVLTATQEIELEERRKKMLAKLGY